MNTKIPDKSEIDNVLSMRHTQEVFEKLKNAYADDKEKAAKYAKLLYGQSVLAAGIALEDKAEFNSLICDLM